MGAELVALDRGARLDEVPHTANDAVHVGREGAFDDICDVGDTRVALHVLPQAEVSDLGRRPRLDTLTSF